MYGGRTRFRDASWARRLRRGPVRVGASASMVAMLAAALVAGGREPSGDVLATSPGPPRGQTTGPTGPPAVPPVQLPDPSGREVRGPASPSQSGRLAASSRAQSIPPVALAAYQRSALVIDAADPSCNLDWSLLAAIGQVESDHGQLGGGHLNKHGVAHPAVIGPRLDGRHGTSRVRDTDAGRVDGDRRFDRAVGPMQFLPSTWAAVAVDGDDDGRRDAQDIDDASLGSAVYLCADHDDLSTEAGARTALLRYNHSRAYAARVMAIAHALHTSNLLLPSTDVTVRSISFQSPLRTHQTHRHPGRDGRHAGHLHAHQQGDEGEPPLLPPTHGPVITDPIPPSSPTPTPTPGPASTPTPTPTTPTTPTPTPTPATPTPTPTPTTPTPTPTDPPEPPVLPDPLPSELAGLTPEQVDAYNAAWAFCNDELEPGWSADPDAVDELAACLADQVADQMGEPSDDPLLVTFVDWLASTQDLPTE